MFPRTQRSAANLVATVGVVACLVLQALQSFVLAPLAGAECSYLLTLLGLFLFATSVAALSFLKSKFSRVGAVLYATFFTWLWWDFIRKRQICPS